MPMAEIAVARDMAGERGVLTPFRPILVMGISLCRALRRTRDAAGGRLLLWPIQILYVVAAEGTPGASPTTTERHLSTLLRMPLDATEREGVHRVSDNGHKAVVGVAAPTPATTLTAPEVSWRMNKASRNESARNSQ